MRASQIARCGLVYIGLDGWGAATSLVSSSSCFRDFLLAEFGRLHLWHSSGPWGSGWRFSPLAWGCCPPASPSAHRGRPSESPMLPCSRRVCWGPLRASWGGRLALPLAVPSPRGSRCSLLPHTPTHIRQIFLNPGLRDPVHFRAGYGSDKSEYWKVKWKPNPDPTRTHPRIDSNNYIFQDQISSDIFMLIFFTWKIEKFKWNV